MWSWKELMFKKSWLIPTMFYITFVLQNNNSLQCCYLVGCPYYALAVLLFYGFVFVGDRMWDLLVSVGQVLGFREAQLAEMSGSGGAS